METVQHFIQFSNTIRVRLVVVCPSVASGGANAARCPSSAVGIFGQHSRQLAAIVSVAATDPPASGRGLER